MKGLCCALDLLLWADMKQRGKKTILKKQFLGLTSCHSKNARFKSNAKPASVFFKQASNDKKTKYALNFFRTRASDDNDNKRNTLHSSAYCQAGVKECKSNFSDTGNENSIWEQCKQHFVAMDCEMVESTRSHSQLARCSVVNHNGELLFDAYVQPEYPVRDYRHTYSGIKPEHLHPSSALSFERVQTMVSNVLKGKMLVGHSLHNDFRALKFSLPSEKVIDIQTLPPLRMLMRQAGVENKSRLKIMSRVIIGRAIQINTHCSVEDARATMDLFKHVFDNWAHAHRHIIKSLLENQTFLDDKYWNELDNKDDN